MSNEFDTLVFFEHARKISEATYSVNPLDADVRFLIPSIYSTLVLLFQLKSIFG